MHVFDLDQAARTVIFQQDIHPAVRSIGHFATHLLIARKLGDAPLSDRLGRQHIRMPRVDAGVSPRLRAGQLDQLPSVLQLAFRVVAGREPDAHSRLGKAHHRAGVGTMRRHHSPIIEPDISEKTLVSSLKLTGYKRAGKQHDVRVGCACARGKGLIRREGERQPSADGGE